MANELMQGLLSNLLTPVDPRVAQRAEGARLVDMMNTPGAAATYYAPQRAADFTKGLGQLFGMDTRTSADKLRDQLTKQAPDLSTAAGLRQLAQLAEQSGDKNTAAQLNLQATMMATQEAQAAKVKTDAATEVTNARSGLVNILNASDMPLAKRANFTAAINKGTFDGKANDILKAAFPEGNDKYKVVGNNIFDNENGTWLTPPKAEAGVGSSASDTAPLDPSDYDSKSWADFTLANGRAQTAEAQQAALNLLKPKAEEGKEWRIIGDKTFMYPIAGSEAAIKITGQVAAANQSGFTGKRTTANSITVIDRALEALTSGDASVGLGGLILSVIPNTNEFNLKGDIDTVLANLGITQLQEMRAASVNGASGFGQLTQKELERLETRIRNLSRGQTKDQLIDNLLAIKEEFATIGGRAKDDWTVDSWLGIPSTTSTVTGTSGTVYNVLAE